MTFVMMIHKAHRGRVETPSRSQWWGALCAVFMLGLFAVPSQAVARGAPDSFADLAEKLLPTVVNISTTREVEAEETEGYGLPQFPPGSPFEDLFRDYFDKFHGQNGKPKHKEQTRSLGSGFVISEDGLIVTNNHVIEDATEIIVSFHDGSELPAKLIGRDPKTDIALLRVQSSDDLPYAKFGDSDKSRVGDWVLAIGNPFGLGGTVTAGIISAGNRDIHAGPYDNFLQTDAPINRGNSGGPMFNMDGEVIGVNSMIFSPTGGSVGIGFAIPSDTVKLVIKDIEKFGHVKRGWLGVVIQTVTNEIAESLGMPDSEGALVQGVQDDSPADQAGILTGDVIVEFNGNKVGKMRTLPRIVAETEIGKKVPVKIFRNGRERTLHVEVGEMTKADENMLPGKVKPKAKATSGEKIKGLDLTVATITDALRDQYDLQDTDKGVVILAVGKDSVAAEKGLLPGMIIQSVTQQAVASPKDVQKAVDAAQKAGRPSVLLQIRRGERERFIALKLSD